MKMYIKIETKSVKDFDGFWTEYTMWALVDTKREEVIEYCFVLGDSDIYSPKNSPIDWECDSVEEAVEWWKDIDEDYFVDDEDDILDGDLEDCIDYFYGRKYFKEKGEQKCVK